MHLGQLPLLVSGTYFSLEVLIEVLIKVLIEVLIKGLIGLPHLRVGLGVSLTGDDVTCRQTRRARHMRGPF